MGQLLLPRVVGKDHGPNKASLEKTKFKIYFLLTAVPACSKASQTEPLYIGDFCASVLKEHGEHQEGKEEPLQLTQVTEDKR